MESIRRFAHSLDCVARAIVAEVKTAASGQKNVDCVFIVGPNEPGVPDELRRLARMQGLSYVIIGDGHSPVTKQMIVDARRAGVIGKDTEVFSNTHGGMVDKGADAFHGLDLDLDADLVSPGDFIRWLREPLDFDQVSDEATAWSGNIHLLACHVGKFRDEFKTGDEGGQDLWKQGHVFLHGSGKMLYTGAGLADVETVIREIAVSKRNDGQRPGSMQIFRALVEQQADTVTLMGGNLAAPLVSHAPKSVIEMLPGSLQAQWRQMDANAKLSTGAVRLAGEDQDIAALLDAQPVSVPKVVKLKHAINMVFTRLVHLRNQDKLERLLSDLTTFPGLVHLRDKSGVTPLILVATLPRVKGLRVGRHVAAQELIVRGADVNARDKFGRTALHYAVLNGDVALVNVLLKAGADPYAIDGSGNSLCHLIAESNKAAGLQLLRTSLKDMINLSLEKKNKNGKTPLQIANENVLRGGDRHVLSELQSRNPTAKHKVK